MAKRVLLVNKFYYPRGGDCVVVLNTQAQLRESGVEAEVFVMDYPDNLPARYQDRFASRVDFGGSKAAQWRAMRRALGNAGVGECFERVLDDFKPDVVHLHNIHSYLSPVVAQLAHARGVRVVWTLHDYKLLCPRYDCLLDGKPCDKCIAGSKFNAVSHRCMKGSLPASVVGWLEALKWNRRTLERCVDTFVCPSEFMAGKMRQGGFQPGKITVLNNFLDPVKLQQYQAVDSGAPRDGYYCYVGRLSAEKGVDALLDVASRLPYRLKVAGGGPLAEEMQRRYAGCANIELLGMLDAGRVARLLSGARLSVMPSQCNDNNPLSVVESLCAGTPVAGSQMGGIPELIDGDSGTVFRPFDREALAAAITASMARDWDHAGIARRALQRFAPQRHMQALMRDIYRL